jgi:hypothetical protein
MMWALESTLKGAIESFERGRGNACMILLYDTSYYDKSKKQGKLYSTTGCSYSWFCGDLAHHCML